RMELDAIKFRNSRNGEWEFVCPRRIEFDVMKKPAAAKLRTRFRAEVETYLARFGGTGHGGKRNSAWRVVSMGSARLRRAGLGVPPRRTLLMCRYQLKCEPE